MRLARGPGIGRLLEASGWLTLAVLIVGCAPESGPTGAPVPTPTVYTSAVTFADLPGWQGDNQAEALAALTKSCSKLASMPPETDLGGLAGPARHMQQICSALQGTSITSAREGRAFFERWFAPVSLPADPEAGSPVYRVLRTRGCRPAHAGAGCGAAVRATAGDGGSRPR